LSLYHCCLFLGWVWYKNDAENGTSASVKIVRTGTRRANEEKMVARRMQVEKREERRRLARSRILRRDRRFQKMKEEGKWTPAGKNMKQIRSHHRYEFHKILFEKKCVLVRLRKFDTKRLKLRADQLIRHFTPTEITRAAAKLMKKKQALNF